MLKVGSKPGLDMTQAARRMLNMEAASLDDQFREKIISWTKVRDADTWEEAFEQREAHCRS